MGSLLRRIHFCITQLKAQGPHLGPVSGVTKKKKKFGDRPRKADVRLPEKENSKLPWREAGPLDIVDSDQWVVNKELSLLGVTPLRARTRCWPRRGSGSCLRPIDSCIIQLKAQGPSRACNESKEEEKKKTCPRPKAMFKTHRLRVEFPR